MNWSKLGSRKFLVAVVSTVVMLALQEGGASPEIISAVKWILVSYLGAQGLADYGKARNGHG